jgi:chemotaxis protein MotD
VRNIVPSVNPVQIAEPRLQAPSATQSEGGGEPFSELLDSAVADHHACKEPRAKSQKRHEPPEHAQRNRHGPSQNASCRAEQATRGDTPVRARPHEADSECTETYAKPTETTGEDEIAQTSGANEVEEATAIDAKSECSENEGGGGCIDITAAPVAEEPSVEDPEVAAIPGSEGAASEGLAEFTIVAAEALSTETSPATSLELGEEIAVTTAFQGDAKAPVPNLGATVDPEVAPAAPLPNIQPAVSAVSAPTQPAADADGQNSAIPALTTSGDTKKTSESAQTAQSPAPALAPAPAPAPAPISPSTAGNTSPSTEGAVANTAQQQDGHQVAELARSLKAAGPASADNTTAVPPSNDAPKPQVNTAVHSPVPEPVRALASSLNAASLHAANVNEPNPVPLKGTALAIEIISRMREGMRRFEIRLDPPELGRIDVRLEVDRHGQASTKLTVERPETLDLLQREARGLERALQQAGLKTENGGLEFSLRQQTNDGWAHGQPHQSRQSPALVAGEDNELVEAVIDGYRSAAHARGGVDIRI